MLCRSVVQKVKNKTYKAIKKSKSQTLGSVRQKLWKERLLCLSVVLCQVPLLPQVGPPKPS